MLGGVWGNILLRGATLKEALLFSVHSMSVQCEFISRPHNKHCTSSSCMPSPGPGGHVRPSTGDNY